MLTSFGGSLRRESLPNPNGANTANVPNAATATASGDAGAHTRAFAVLDGMSQRCRSAAALGASALVLHEDGDTESALEMYQRAIAHLSREPRAHEREESDDSEELTRVYSAFIAIAHASRGDVSRATAALARASSDGTQNHTAETNRLATIARTFVDVASAPSSEDRAARAASAREIIAASPDDGPYVGVARRLFEKLEAENASSTRLSSQAPVLVIGEGARWLGLPNGDRVEVAGRRLRSVLLALAEHREAHPGAPLARDSLLERCWPGEKTARGTRLLRLRHILWRLRALGLRDVLLATAKDCKLDPAVPIVVRTTAW